MLYLNGGVSRLHSVSATEVLLWRSIWENIMLRTLLAHGGVGVLESMAHGGVS